MADLGSVVAGSAGDKIRVFVSYDREHDGDLHELLAEQASKAASGFEITAVSRGRAPEREDALRREIRDVDEVIIICGEHTQDSERVGNELRIAQEEKRPYFLLWGRREMMCTRPTTAKPADSMYSWTWEILREQILSLRRASRANERLAELGRVHAPKGRPPRPR
jgi:hypothetical protein